jgi:putative transposase
MKGNRFTEEQIIRILQEANSGLSVADICRKHNCSEQSFFRWKTKFGGMDISEAKRLRELEREHRHLLLQ